MEDIALLELLVTDEEVFAALRSLKPYKAPGPDGLQAGFFQRFWLIVGNSVKAEVKQIFNSGKISEYLNKTLITLISKCNSPESLSNYSPIGLCNNVYKVIIKLLVARIRPALDYLVSSLQTAFVPKRKGVDNAIIVQELIHSMSKKKGKDGFMAIKIDLEKAYDRLGWSFIRDTLALFNFPNHLSSLIMSCVSTSFISVLYNGGALDPFHPLKGIRQGDPHSPYLFILCMEVLAAFIIEKCKAKLWDPISASRGDAAFSHLFLADDLVLFAKANVKNCRAVRNVLDTFCGLSSKKERNSLWPRVLAHKYNGRRRNHRVKLGSCSPTWAVLKKGETVFAKGLKWIAGMNSGLSFWYDKWLSDGPLRSSWLRINCALQQKSFSGINWGIVFPFGIWSLWLWRNKVVFRDTSSRRPLKAETLARAVAFAFLGVNGRAGGGGLIRDSNGTWVSRYARAIGHTTSVAAELWEIRDGINLCIDLNLTNVVVELDAKIVVDLLLKEEGNVNGNDVLITDCKEGLQRIPRVQVQHCFREVNKCADALARRGAVSPQDFVIYQSSPINVAMLASLDAVGTLYERIRSFSSSF
ncbi:uncharacterized protein LOC142639425 [Castanea sativa]|uniref:uncharacterized protein LOC142639425 n=1 Tax=Castanea sativa TaxID=21020 RepID=UPI003F64A185